MAPSAGQRQLIPPALRVAPLVTMGVEAGGFSTGAGGCVTGALGGGGVGTSDSAGLPAMTTGVFVVVAGAGTAGGKAAPVSATWAGGGWAAAGGCTG